MAIRNQGGYRLILRVKKRDALGGHLVYLLLYLCDPFRKLVRKFKIALLCYLVGISEQCNSCGGVGVDAKHKILRERVNRFAVGFLDCEFVV